jgi:hypothetical protein
VHEVDKKYVALIASSIITVAGVAAYSTTRAALVELYASTGHGLWLIELIYVPSLIAVASIATSIPLTVYCLSGTCQSLVRAAWRGLKSSLMVLVPGAVFSLLGLAVKGPEGYGVYLFTALTVYASIAYEALAVAWFFAVMPALLYTGTECRGVFAATCLRGMRLNTVLGSVFKWLFSLLATGWATFILRILLTKVSPALSETLTSLQLGNAALTRLLEPLPRIVDLVIAPLWVVLLSLMYARYARLYQECVKRYGPSCDRMSLA